MSSLGLPFDNIDYFLYTCGYLKIHHACFLQLEMSCLLYDLNLVQFSSCHFKQIYLNPLTEFEMYSIKPVKSDIFYPFIFQKKIVNL
jgi:hypothetical protein